MRLKGKQRNVWDSFCNKSDSSIIPPWCSSGKVSRRKLVPKCEIQSSYPLRKNIWEYLHDGRDFHKRRREVRQRGKRIVLFWIAFLLLLAGFMTYLWRFSALPASFNLTDELFSRTKLLSLEWKPFVDEECCLKMKYLASELYHAQHRLRKSYRVGRMARTKPITENSNRQYIEGAVASKGSNTIEWGSRVALWGIVPLWKASPPPTTVLSLRTPTPADCWPFIGPSGELIIELPTVQQVSSISIEHVRPDTAKSAPKNFIIYGILANNTMTKLIKSYYQSNGPAKQYFEFSANPYMRSLIFRVLTNYGNTKYTCVYRIHLYSNKLMGF